MTNPWAFGWDAVAALATAGAATAAVIIWRTDTRRSARARAARISARLEPDERLEFYHPFIIRLVLHNGSDTVAYDLAATHPEIELDPIRIPVLPPGETRRVRADSQLIPANRYNDPMRASFTIDGRRWHLNERGQLRGGRRDRMKPDPRPHVADAPPPGPV